MARTVEQLIAAGHYRRALAQLTAPGSTDAPPGESARHAYLLSRVQLGLGELEDSLQLAEKAAAIDSGSAAYHVQVAAAAGRSAEHASMFKQLGFAKRAHKELEQAIALDPKNEDALYGLILFADLAPSFIGGDKARAAQLASQLTELNPVRGYAAQAALAHNRKDYAAEEGLLKKAVAVDGASPEALFDAHIAYARFANGASHIDTADEQTCEALALDPGRAEPWQLLAQMAAAADCPPEVDGLLHVARQFDPDDLSPAYFAAVEWISAGRHLDAADALLRLYLGSPQEGGTPSEGRARYQLALVRERLGTREEALALMRMAVEEDPTIDEAKKDLKRLEHASPAPAK